MPEGSAESFAEPELKARRVEVASAGTTVESYKVGEVVNSVIIPGTRKSKEARIDPCARFRGCEMQRGDPGTNQRSPPCRSDILCSECVTCPLDLNPRGRGEASC